MKSRMFAILMVVMGLIGGRSVVAHDLVDLSILLPLPVNAANNTLLRASDAGRLGPLLPDPLIAQLPLLVASLDQERTYRDLLRVVAIRIDPCFSEGTSPCRKQIRFVWQPLVESSGSPAQYSTKDAAIHTFHDLNDSEWNAFLAEYANLRLKSPVLPSKTVLSIHPLVQAQGLEGPFWMGLKSLLLKYCGQGNLVRITSMSLDFTEIQWVFRGWNVTGLLLKAMEIPRLQTKGQVVSSRHLNSPDFRMTVFPSAFSEAALWFYNDSVTAKNRLAESDLIGITREAIEAENPLRQNPGTTDCASCHLAGATVSWGQRQFPNWDWQGLFKNERFENNSPMPAPDLTTDQLRAFGYFGQRPIVSTRVLNETLHALERLTAERFHDDRREGARPKIRQDLIR